MPGFDFISEPLFWIAGVAAFAGALIRGFSGFGSGLVFMPIGAACLGPQNAAGILYIIDTLLIIPFVFRAVPLADWREVLPIGVGAALLAPVGVAALIALDPTLVRWGVSLAILARRGATLGRRALSRADAHLALAACRRDRRLPERTRRKSRDRRSFSTCSAAT